MELILLNRLQITGQLDNETPTVVITEVAASHGISYEESQLNDYRYVNQLLQLINETTVHPVSKPYTRKMYRYINRYVNANCEWPAASLESAFNFLRRYTASQEISPDFTIGPQTPPHPYSLNASILYRLCRHNQIRVNRTTTLEQMAMAIRLLIQPLAFIQNALATQLAESSQKNQLINALMSVNRLSSLPSLPDSRPSLASSLPPVDFSKLEEIHHVYQDSNSLFRRIQPRDHNEAIVFAAMAYRIDLTYFTFPLDEYVHLSERPFVPQDERLRKVVTKNPTFLSLRHHYNPYLPANLYSNEELSNLAVREGFTQEEPMNFIEFLNSNYHLETFYSGYQLGIRNSDTHISYETVDELDNGEIICYGVKSDQIFDAFTYHELVDTFRQHRAFIHPTRRDVSFSNCNMRKLKLICQEIRPTEAAEASNARRILLATIMETENFLSETNVHIRTFHQRYLELPEAMQGRIQRLFRDLFHLSMYMRGWNGTGAYPIAHSRNPEGTPAFEVVTRNIAVRVIGFTQACEDLGEIGSMILDLPICTYHGDKYVYSTNSGDGRTIRERLIIVANGDSITNMASCIRLSSNWFAYTAHRYHLLLSMDLPFSVTQLIGTA